MRLLTSFLALALATPLAFVTAAFDPTSIPVLVKTWTKDCSREITTPGLIMIRSNHPCYELLNKTETQTTQTTGLYQSQLDVAAGNFTIMQYNIPSGEATTHGKCNAEYSQQKNYSKIYTNIPLRTCVQGLGYSFDWEPADEYIGYSYYMGASASSCDDDLEQNTVYGNAIKVGTCVPYATETGQRKFVEWSNSTVSQCVITDGNCASNATCGLGTTMVGAYQLKTCTREKNEPDIEEPNYLYWVKFGGNKTTTTNNTAAPSSTAPSSTAPSSTAPSSTAPSSTAPSSTAPSSTAPSSTAPSSTAPSSTAPSSTAPSSTAPSSTAPSSTAPSSTAPSSTAASSTAASSTGASSTAGPGTTNPPSTPSPTTPAPALKPNGANLVAHTSIFTLIACIGVVLGAQL